MMVCCVRRLVSLASAPMVEMWTTLYGRAAVIADFRAAAMARLGETRFGIEDGRHDDEYALGAFESCGQLGRLKDVGNSHFAPALSPDFSFALIANYGTNP